MNTELIIELAADLIAVAVLVLFLIRGGRRGLFLAMNRFVRFVLAVFAAQYVAGWLTPVLAEWFAPQMVPYIAEKLSDTVARAVATEGEGLGVLALIPDMADVVAGAAGAVADTVAAGIAYMVAKAVLWVVVFLLAYVVARLLLRLLRRIFEAADHLPGLHFLNHLCGGLLGLIEGCLVAALAAALLVYFNVLSPSLIQRTYILRFLAGWII